eukprot:6214158-Pleurochrysis_carterae.AAC.1
MRDMLGSVLFLGLGELVHVLHMSCTSALTRTTKPASKADKKSGPAHSQVNQHTSKSGMSCELACKMSCESASAMSSELACEMSSELACEMSSKLACEMSSEMSSEFA